MNGISNRISDNEKVEKAKEIHDNLEVDILAYNEHRLNLHHHLNVNGFNQMFKGGEMAIQLVKAHNTHENIGCVQEGGTSLLAFGNVIEYLDHKQPGKDETGLGQWSVMTFKGDNGIQTRIVCSYNPCFNPTALALLHQPAEGSNLPADKILQGFGVPAMAVATG
jgi:hypothetical protein